MLDELTEEAILAAIQSFRELGRAHFFEYYEIRRQARTWFIMYEGRLYDLKGIARVASDIPQGGFPQSTIVAAAVQELGFEVVHFEKNQQDGAQYGGQGEGENHEHLRLRVRDNPHEILDEVDNIETDTEVLLLSGDRVDVVYYIGTEIIVIECKSRDSNLIDLRRGLYQCVKYEAVYVAQCRAQNVQEFSVRAVLVTEEHLPDELQNLPGILGIEHVVLQHDG